MWRKVEFCNTKWDTQARGHFRTTNTSRRCGKFWKLCWINTHVLCNVQILKSAVFAVSQYFATKKLLGGIAPLLVQSLHHLGVILTVVAVRCGLVAGSKCRQQPPSPTSISAAPVTGKKHKHVFMPRPAAATVSWPDDGHRRLCAKMYGYLSRASYQWIAPINKNIT